MIKIALGPTGAQSRVIDVESGDDLTSIAAVEAISVRVTGGDVTRADLEVWISDGSEALVDDENARWFTTHPITGKLAKLAKLTFADGTEVDFASGKPVVIS